MYKLSVKSRGKGRKNSINPDSRSSKACGKKCVFVQGFSKPKPLTEKTDTDRKLSIQGVSLRKKLGLQRIRIAPNERKTNSDTENTIQTSKKNRDVGGTIFSKSKKAKEDAQEKAKKEAHYSIPPCVKAKKKVQVWQEAKAKAKKEAQEAKAKAQNV